RSNQVVASCWTTRLTIRNCARQARNLSPLNTRRYIMRVQTLIGTLLAGAFGLTAWSGTALAGKLDALLGDWDLNIAKSKFKPNPPMKKYTMKVIDAGEGHLLIKS